MNKPSSFPPALPLSREDVIIGFKSDVLKIARFIRRSLPPHIELDDLVQVGTEGMIKAIDSYDSRKGELLKWIKSMAYYEIKEHLRHGGESVIRLPRYQQGKMQITMVSYDEWTKENRIDATGPFRRLHPALIDNTPVVDIDRQDKEVRAWQAMEKLPPKVRPVFKLYFLDGKTMKQIGQRRGVCESQISRTISRGTMKLRSAA